MNIEFQSEHFRLHVLYSIVSSEYQNLLSFFIKDKVIQNLKLSEIDPNNQNHYESGNDVYLGCKTTAHLLSDSLINSDVTKRFKSDCLKFLAESCTQIKKRFDFNEDGVIAKLSVLNPKLALTKNTLPTSIILLAVHFSSAVPEGKLNYLDDQWRSYCTVNVELLPSTDKIPGYWFKLRDINDALNNPKLYVFSNFMTTLSVLPHSSACV